MPRTLSDDCIIALYNARDETAIAATAHKYGHFCMSVAYGILQSRPDAEECVNDTYHDAWNAMPPHRPSILSTLPNAGSKIPARIAIIAITTKSSTNVNLFFISPPQSK